MDHPRLTLRILPQTYAICSFPPECPIPDWAQDLSIVSITRTSKQLTIVCEQDHVTDDCSVNRDWKCIQIEGSFDLDAVGVLTAISVPLAREGISIYVVSTFDTDYILVPGAKATAARGNP